MRALQEKSAPRALGSPAGESIFAIMSERPVFRAAPAVHPAPGTVHVVQHPALRLTVPVTVLSDSSGLAVHDSPAWQEGAQNVAIHAGPCPAWLSRSRYRTLLRQILQAFSNPCRDISREKDVHQPVQPTPDSAYPPARRAVLCASGSAAESRWRQIQEAARNDRFGNRAQTRSTFTGVCPS